MWALTDFTAENGATLVVPGSNRWDSDPEPGRAYDTVALEMPAGNIASVVGSCYARGPDICSRRTRGRRWSGTTAGGTSTVDPYLDYRSDLHDERLAAQKGEGPAD